MKSILSLIIIFFILSCNSDRKENKLKDDIVKNSIDTLAIYNYALNDLLENEIYHNYLGEKWELLYTDLVKNKIDSIVYLEKLSLLKNTIVENDSLKGTLYINEPFKGFTQDNYSLKIYEIGVKSFENIKNLGFDIDSIITEIGKENYINKKALKSKFVKIESLSNESSETSELFSVGTLSFSKLILNYDKTIGVLFFEFSNEEKYNEGAILFIKKLNNQWVVEKKHTLWKT